MSNRPEPKPCPCCGSIDLSIGDALFIEYHGHEHCNGAVQCNTCGLELQVDASSSAFPCSCHHDVQLEAINRWNKRV